MAATTTNSAEYANSIAVPPVMNDPTTERGRIRLMHFDFASITGDADSLVNLGRMPAGKVKILRIVANHSAWAASTTLEVGHTGYTNASNTAVAAAEAAFLAATAMDNTTAINAIVDVDITSKAGFLVQGVLKVGAGTAETLKGWIEYVQD